MFPVGERIETSQVAATVDDRDDVRSNLASQNREPECRVHMLRTVVFRRGAVAGLRFRRNVVDRFSIRVPEQTRERLARISERRSNLELDGNLTGGGPDRLAVERVL